MLSSTLPDEVGHSLTDPVEIFNDRYFSSHYCSTAARSQDPAYFPLFLSLPKELRYQIWAENLLQRRFLRVQLEDASDNPPQSGIQPKEYVVYNSNGAEDALFLSPIEAPTAMVNGDRILMCKDEAESGMPQPNPPLVTITFARFPTSPFPTLPLVCREAYHVYLDFYRIRLPAFISVPSYNEKPNEYITKPITAYLHPTLDIISVHTSTRSRLITNNLLPFFCHTVLQHDYSPAKSRFGARNLCLDLMRFSLESEDLKPLEADIVASTRLTISHLRNLYFSHVMTTHVEPRLMSGPLTGSRSKPWYNASVPILPTREWGFSSAIECIKGIDPRLAGPEGIADLHQIWIGDDAHCSRDIWSKCERAWKVRAGSAMPSGGCRVRTLVALAGEAMTKGIQDFELPCSIQRALIVERCKWLRSIVPGDEGISTVERELLYSAEALFLPGYRGGGPATTPEEWILKRQPQSAMGFWLIDTERLEAAPTVGLVGKRVADLSAIPEALKLWAFEGLY